MVIVVKIIGFIGYCVEMNFGDWLVDFEFGVVIEDCEVFVVWVCIFEFLVFWVEVEVEWIWEIWWWCDVLWDEYVVVVVWYWVIFLYDVEVSEWCG